MGPPHLVDISHCRPIVHLEEDVNTVHPFGEGLNCEGACLKFQAVYMVTLLSVDQWPPVLVPLHTAPQPCREASD